MHVLQMVEAVQRRAAAYLAAVRMVLRADDVRQLLWRSGVGLLFETVC